MQIFDLLLIFFVLKYYSTDDLYLVSKKLVELKSRRLNRKRASIKHSIY